MKIELSLFVGACLSLLTAALIGVAKYRDQSNRLRIILLGEISNLEAHLSYAASDILSDPIEPALKLKVAKYGPITCLPEALSRVGSLDEKLIESLIQLNLRVRNDDIYLDWAIDQSSAGRYVEYDLIVQRLRRTAQIASGLAASLQKHRVPLWRALWP